MERLTIDEIIEHCDRKTGMYEKACDVKYLETAFMGNGIKEYWEHKQVAEYLKKLKEYKDLDGQGLLLRLPCKVGDKLYRITPYAKEPIITTHVLQINIKQFFNGKIIVRIDVMDKIGESCYFLDDIGKKIFLSRAEAEGKLAEMEGAE